MIDSRTLGDGFVHHCLLVGEIRFFRIELKPNIAIADRDGTAKEPLLRASPELLGKMASHKHTTNAFVIFPIQLLSQLLHCLSLLSLSFRTSNF